MGYDVLCKGGGRSSGDFLTCVRRSSSKHDARSLVVLTRVTVSLCKDGGGFEGFLDMPEKVFNA
jgi:hypothetical protein